VSEKPRLLIVDDDKDTLESLSDVLEVRGYTIETAKTGKEAFSKIRKCSFDVALIDIKLPDVSGILLLQTFRKNQPAMMNIMITAHSTQQTAIDALNHGANAFILKPIDHEKLDKMINKCLAHKNAVLSLM
jgi:DNA-binding NtrC family response regulator